MKKIGFNISGESNELVAPKAYVPSVEEPRLSVVTVRFDDGREFPYLNDKFDLKVGDKVYVDGKLQGELGVVIAVTTKFKVSLKFYKYVLSKADFSFKGTFTPVADFVVSRGEEAIPFEQLVTWMPPAPADCEDEVFICGEGHSINLENIEGCEGFDYDKANDAIEMLNNWCVKFISVINGEGMAFIERRRPHIVEFKLKGNEMTDIFCDCLSPALCKDILAVAFASKKIIDTMKLGERESFTAIENGLFGLATENTEKTIVV